MPRKMNWLRVAFAAVAFSVSTFVHVALLLAAALLKALLPVRGIRRALDPILTGIAESWIGFNTWMIGTLTHTRLVLEVDAALRHDGHYLVIANHQSWVDIPMLQAALNRKIPLLRFFLKSQLFWVPLLGLAWWALDFPFMRRHSREQLARNPQLAGRDIAATRRACLKFANVPVAVMSFAEGTRFTTGKHSLQSSPFTHLLKPRAGGVGIVLDAMGGTLHSLLDITLVYPHGRPTFADLFNDRIPLVRIRIRERPIPAQLVGSDYQNDPEARARVQDWVNDIWREKDAAIRQILAA
jgi:1-acyl-sn-glycerol-3-phosphate acyltransferase